LKGDLLFCPPHVSGITGYFLGWRRVSGIARFWREGTWSGQPFRFNPDGFTKYQQLFLVAK
jgi:hypothetical protein